MLDKNTYHKCELCGKKAEHTFGHKHYCRPHYLDEIFGCRGIHTFLKNNNLSHIHSVWDNHIILRSRNKEVLEMCSVLNLVPDQDYWFGKGMLGMNDFSNYMHINVKGLEDT